MKLRTRSQFGSAIIEAPFVLYIMLFFLFFPLINLGTVFIRMTMLYYADHTACSWAARARSFKAPINSDPTALQLAQAGSDSVIGLYTGIHVSDVDTLILITNINNQQQTVTDKPLTTPADISNYTYQVQVKTVGSADPIFFLPLPFSIPGLNASLPVSFVDRAYFENPTGLTY
jgi:hypothetical protein